MPTSIIQFDNISTHQLWCSTRHMYINKIIKACCRCDISTTLPTCVHAHSTHDMTSHDMTSRWARQHSTRWTPWLMSWYQLVSSIKWQYTACAASVALTCSHGDETCCNLSTGCKGGTSSHDAQRGMAQLHNSTTYNMSEQIWSIHHNSWHVTCDVLSYHIVSYRVVSCRVMYVMTTYALNTILCICCSSSMMTWCSVMVMCHSCSIWSCIVSHQLFVLSPLSTKLRHILMLVETRFTSSLALCRSKGCVCVWLCRSVV